MAVLTATVGEVFNPGVGDMSVSCTASDGKVQMRYTSGSPWLEVCDLPAGRELIVTVTALSADYRIVCGTSGASVFARDGAS